MADIAPVVVGGAIALAGVLVTSGVQLLVNSRAHKQQLERDTVAYERQEAAAKRERLIGRYEEASRAAEAYIALMRRMMTSAKEEWAHIAHDSETTFNKLRDVKAVLALEDGTDEVIKFCDQLQGDFLIFWQDALRGDFKSDRLDKTIVALRETIRAHLKALESAQ